MPLKLRKILSTENIIVFLLLLLLSLIILFIYHYPDYYASLMTPENMVYLGQNSYFDPWDINFYVSNIHYGQRAGITLPNLYTSQANHPVLLFTVLTGIGALFKNINPFLLYHLSSLVTGFILIIGIFFLLKKLGFSKWVSLFSLIIICLGGGFGFLSFDKFSSADIIESSLTFYTAFYKPHEAIAILCYLSALIFSYSYFLEKKFRLLRLIAILFLLSLAFFIYPYFVASFFIIILCFLFYLRNFKLLTQDYASLLILLAPSLFIVFIVYRQFALNPTFQNVGEHLSIGLISLLLGYGILIPLLILEIFFFKKSPLKIFLFIWFLSTLALALFPLGPQKIILRGLFFPASLIGILSLNDLSKYKPQSSFWFYTAFSFFLLGSSIFIFSERIKPNNYLQSPWVYISKEEFSLLSYLNQKTPPNKNTLSLYKLGNLIPSHTNDRAYFGHFSLTPDGFKKDYLTKVFFSGEAEGADVKKFLQENKINYVLWGKNENEIYEKNLKANKITKNSFSSLKLVYKNHNYKVFSVLTD